MVFLNSLLFKKFSIAQSSVFFVNSIYHKAAPEPGDIFWITDTEKKMITDTGKFMIFGGVVPPPPHVLWVDNLNDDMITNEGDFFIFSS